MTLGMKYAHKVSVNIAGVKRLDRVNTSRGNWLMLVRILLSELLARRKLG
jgi:hypothetical protein